ncbi:hypothetical protein BKA93DRAFT_751167 [Sparassis latifolia]
MMKKQLRTAGQRVRQADEYLQVILDKSRDFCKVSGFEFATEYEGVAGVNIKDEENDMLIAEGKQKETSSITSSTTERVNPKRLGECKHAWELSKVLSIVSNVRTDGACKSEDIPSYTTENCTRVQLSIGLNLGWRKSASRQSVLAVLVDQPGRVRTIVKGFEALKATIIARSGRQSKSTFGEQGIGRKTVQDCSPDKE